MTSTEAQRESAHAWVREIPQRPILLGLIWGVLQGTIMAGAFYLGTLVYFQHFYPLTLSGDALWVAFCLSLVIGFLAANVRRSIKSLLIAQPVTFVVGFTAPWLYGFSLSLPTVLSMLNSSSIRAELVGTEALIFMSGLMLLLFFLSLVGGGLGALLGDWRSPSSKSNLNWKFLSIGVLLDALAVIWATPNPDIRGIPQIGDSWAVSLMAVLVVAGFSFLFLGLTRKGVAEVEHRGLLIISSVLMVGLTIGSVSRVSFMAGLPSFPELYLRPGFEEAQDLLHVTWLLWASLIIPALTILGCLIPTSLSDKAHPAS